MDIFVGSIPFKWKEKDLIEVFSQYGNVDSVKIVINKMTRQNKGFGFITMMDDKEAANAVKYLNGQEFLGRTIVVMQSDPTIKSAKVGRSPRETPKSVSKNSQQVPWFRKR